MIGGKGKGNKLSGMMSMARDAADSASEMDYDSERGSKRGFNMEALDSVVENMTEMKEMLQTTISENEAVRTAVETVTEEMAAMRKALVSSSEEMIAIKEEIVAVKEETLDAVNEIKELLASMQAFLKSEE